MSTTQNIFATCLFHIAQQHPSTSWFLILGLSSYTTCSAIFFYICYLGGLISDLSVANGCRNQ